MEKVLEILLNSLPEMIVALVGAGGFWAYVEHRYNDRKKAKSTKLDTIIKELKDVTESISKTDAAVYKLSDCVDDLSQGQMQCATKLDKIRDIENKFGDLEDLIQDVKTGNSLSLAFSRDRVNHLANIYMKLGYIPQDEYIAFKLLGQAYLDAGGNSEIKEKYEYCIEELEVVDKPRKIILNTYDNLENENK